MKFVESAVLSRVAAFSAMNLTPTRSPRLLNEIADLVFSELHVLALCLMTPGEGVTMIEIGENSVVVDVGYRETRVETFVGWELVDRVVVERGGCHVESLSDSSDADPREVIFSADSNGESVPETLRRVLELHELISSVVVVGSTSFRFDKQYMADKCGVSFNGRTVKYILPPERNKSAWLGASIAADVKFCQHRFYTASQWKEQGTLYVPLMKPPPSI